MKNALGILGGMGPAATSYLYQMIIDKTKAKTDQEHINTIIFSYCTIPDRTSYILDASKEDPYPYLLDGCKKLEALGVKRITIPCNTACYFWENLQKEISIPISNIVKQTVEFVKGKYETVAIMATEGTIKTKLYQKYLDSFDINYVIVDTNKTMDIIYNYVKKGRAVPRKLFNKLSIQDVDAYILGCTELSILKKKLNLDDKFIDPLEIECNNIINIFRKE